ncbi:glutathione-regulated potassium-efflux system ancillary protein KefG [Methanosarcina siciliae T4/M]|uniref:Glutathione-regulated potassium-efflux system ancillary protein KefG n=1 Tax=Methanosarcina siciliae T4/M TaxID=1434120 RepID=A0A0E3P0J2_9EURY|nr:NAD(P)H-dependent oxidoreductase [Methanosarcina siciliae]AKB26838.1 glutathione-regulated potassium-efflux system ancillary protein KefG [Methanosarcina siciliae T4/M]
MHIYVVYAHPSKSSFTYEVLHSFLKGLSESGNTFEIGDLYAMDFKCELDLDQYTREMSRTVLPLVPDDVKKEQEKIQRSDAVAFVYPVWWSDCPGILKGWFDRVWTVGYAYFYDENAERKSFIKPKKALVLCTAGHTIEYLETTGIAQSMRCIMLKDRLNNVGFTDVKMEILGGMVNKNDLVKRSNLEKAYSLGVAFFKH